MNAKKRIEEEARKELEYRRGIASIKKCEDQLHKQAESLKNSACQAERNGQHAEAIGEIKSVRLMMRMEQYLNKWRNKFCLMHTFAETGKSISGLSTICENMMGMLKTAGNFGTNMYALANIENMMLEFEQYADRMDASLSSVSDFTSVSYASEEDESMLNELLREDQRNAGIRLTNLTNAGLDKAAQKG